MKISMTSLGLTNCLKIIHPPHHVLFPATTVITKRFKDEPLEISTLICMGIGEDHEFNLSTLYRHLMIKGRDSSE
jgi:hypothetical protein